MRAKSLALLVLALGCGLVASIGITQVMKKDGGETADGDAVAVYVAKEDVGHGKTLTSDLLRLEPWPKDKVPAGALSRIEDVEGRTPRAPVWAGTPILESMLYKKGEEPQGGIDANIPPGYRAVGVKLDSVSGGGLLLPKHRVDVIVNVTRLPGRFGQEPISKTFLRNIKVIAVGNVTEIEDTEEGPQKITAKTAQLLVTPKQAQLVNLASELGTIQLVIRGPEEDEEGEDGIPEASIKELFGADEEADLEAEERQPDGGDLSDWLTKVEQQEPPPSDSAVEPPPIKQSESWTMRIMSGEQAEIVVLETERTPASSATGFEFWRPGGFGQNPSTDESEPETQDDLQQEEPVTEDEPAAEGVPNVGEPPASQEEETEPDS